MAAIRGKVGYWRARALCEHIRMLLTHLEVPYDDVFYEMGDGPEFDISGWLQEKERLPMPFPNIPYYAEGDFYLSESWAIMRFLCEKYRPEYLGENLDQRVEAAMLQGVLADMRARVANAQYVEHREPARTIALTESQVPFRRLAAYLRGKRFLLGAKPCYVDFFLYELLEFVEGWEAGWLASVAPEFAEYKRNFQTLAHITEFEARPRLPFNIKKGNCNTTV